MKKNFRSYLDFVIKEDVSTDNPYTLDNGNFGFNTNKREVKSKESLYTLDIAHNLDKDLYDVTESLELIVSDEELKALDLNNMDEGIIRKTVVRGGVKKTIFRSDKEGFKIIIVGNQPKEVPITQREKNTRKISQNIAAKKRAGSEESSQKKRSISMNIGKNVKGSDLERRKSELLGVKRKLDRTISNNREKLTGQ